MELAAYRIVQESLTNTLRHAGPATATVRIGYGDEALDVESPTTAPDPARRTQPVLSAGPTPEIATAGHSSTEHGATEPGSTNQSSTDNGGGHGLIGMRERALATGGTLQAHAGPAGGFLVRARLPLGEGDRLPAAEKENA